MITKFKIYEITHHDIDPYDEEDWEEGEWVPLKGTTILPIGTRVKGNFSLFFLRNIEGTIKIQNVNPIYKDLVLSYYVAWDNFPGLDYVYYDKLLYNPKLVK